MEAAPGIPALFAPRGHRSIVVLVDVRRRPPYTPDSTMMSVTWNKISKFYAVQLSIVCHTPPQSHCVSIRLITSKEVNPREFIVLPVPVSNPNYK